MFEYAAFMLIESLCTVGLFKYYAIRSKLANKIGHNKKPMPVLDWHMRKQAGLYTISQQKNAQRLIKVIKHITDYKAFEYFLIAVINKDSPLRGSFSKLKTGK